MARPPSSISTAGDGDEAGLSPLSHFLPSLDDDDDSLDDSLDGGRDCRGGHHQHRQPTSYPVQSERRSGHRRELQQPDDYSHPLRRGRGAATTNINNISGNMDVANPKHFNAYTGTASTPPRADKRSAQSNNNNNGNNDGAAVDDDLLSQLTQKLSQYTRGADRRQVLRSLADPKLMPRMHVLKSVWVEDIAAAEREAAGERASLNGVRFLQVKSGMHDQIADDKKPVDSYFLQTLREICGHMCDMDGVDADPMALYGGLLLRLSRSVSERDALEVVTHWSCGKGELVVLPLKRRHHDRSCRLPVPIDVELYVESGSVHAKVTMRHELGLYRRTDLESNGLKRELSPWSALVLARGDAAMSSGSSKKLAQIQYESVTSPRFGNARPWVFVDADVVERINFGTGSSVRMLHVSLPEDKNSGYVKKW